MTTYEEYCQLRVRCGYEAEHAMIAEVWNNCDAASQENMLGQFRAFAERAERYTQTHGAVW